MKTWTLETCLMAHQVLPGHCSVKECEKESLPCNCVTVLHSSLAPHPSSVPGPSKVLGGRGDAGELCWGITTFAADTCLGRTCSPPAPLLHLALRFHLASKQHLLPSNVQVPWHVSGSRYSSRHRAAPLKPFCILWHSMSHTCTLSGSFPPRFHLLAHVKSFHLRLNTFGKALVTWRGSRVANDDRTLGSKDAGR